MARFPVFWVDDTRIGGVPYGINGQLYAAVCKLIVSLVAARNPARHFRSSGGRSHASEWPPLKCEHA